MPDVERKYPDFNPLIITIKNEHDRSSFWEILNSFIAKNMNIHSHTATFARETLLKMEESDKRQG